MITDKSHIDKDVKSNDEDNNNKNENNDSDNNVVMINILQHKGSGFISSAILLQMSPLPLDIINNS